MAVKRSRADSTSAVSYTPSRGPKRRQLAGSLPPSSPVPSSSSAFTTPRTPASYNWKAPADSPTNPFGRIRRLTLGTTLPRATSFSKHLPLRFQFVHPRADGRGIDRDGIYRIIQVPLNYTLAHLRKLIHYIFDPATDAEIVEPYSLRRPSRRTSSASSSKGKQVGSIDPVGHLFEVQRKIKMGSAGQIKDAQTLVKASTMRDPYHYPGNDSEDSLWLEDDAGGDNWKWEAEEDFTLSKVWPKGGDLARGVVYHHNAEIKIHVTVNTKKIQGRKGVGNVPFLFLSSGSVSLSDPEGTLRMGSVETLRWNRIGAFDRYLKAEEEKERAARGNELDDDDDDAEGEADPDMSSATLPLYELSSSPFTISSNPVTPFPTEPSTRRRIDYERKRLLKLTKEGMKEAGLSDEEEDELANDDGVKRHHIFPDKPFDWDPFADEEEV